MNAHEYVAKSLQDKRFLTNVYQHVSDDVLIRYNKDDADGTMDISDAWQVASDVLNSAVSGMGIEATKQEIDDECKKQFPSGFQGIRCLLRFGRLIKKEARKRRL